MKQKINMIGGGFRHCGGTNAFILPKKVEWNINDESAPISFHIDSSIFMQPNPNKKNYGMLCEGSHIIHNVVDAVKKNIHVLEQYYELIFTHDVSLLKLSSKMALIPPSSTSWILEGDRKIYKKSKNVSMVASKKVMCTEHHYRQLVAKKYQDKIDLFGRGRKTEIKDKIDGVRDYRFSIAMENNCYNNAYSEKISDCFCVGTIPIYFGPPVVNEIFNPDGIIDIKNFSLNDLTEDLYNDKIEAVKENYHIACNMPFPEDYAFENYIK